RPRARSTRWSSDMQYQLVRTLAQESLVQSFPNGGGCSSVVPPGAHFARNEASVTRACDQPPERACVGRMCRRTRTEDECASNDEEPSQDADCFPSSPGLLDDLNL